MTNSLEDDTFQAALSLVDELVLDVGSDGLPSLYADTVSQTQTRTNRRVKYNEKRKLLRQAGVYGDPNRARKARTMEVASLRRQVERLQLDLEVLQTHIRTNEPAPQQPSAIISSSPQPNKWQEIVLNQRRRRKEAERDNIQLKLMLEKHQNVANRLHGMLQKRATQLTNECSSLMNLVCAKSYMVDVLELRGDYGDFHELLRRLGIAYREMDGVMDANGLNGMTVNPCDVHIREGTEGRFVELFTYKILPFDVRATTDAAWNHFKGVEKHLGNGTIYKKAEKDLDEPYTIVADFTKEVYSNNSRADIKVKQIVRRYVEPERDIVIWVARAKPAEIKHKMLRGLTYSSRGYAVTRQFPDSPPGRELSVLQQCSRVFLDREVDTRFSPDDVRVLKNFLIANAAQNMRVHRELIESALVERARTNGSL